MSARTWRPTATFAVLLALSTTHPANAQQPPVTPPSMVLGPPRIDWLFVRGDAPDDHADALGSRSIIFEPIRLALFSMAVPAGGSANTGCGEAPESIGTATAGAPGFAAQHAAAVQLVPRLTLIGFGRGGRACDAAVGGALVYATPIRKDIWLVASAGILHVPQALAGTPRATGQARVDLVFAQPKGRSLAVGIGTRGLTFGGTL